MNNIEDMIYEINGIQVMLDSDLGKIYHVETKRINEAVKNNPEKFPERFSWILNDEDFDFLRSKFSTLKNKPEKFPERFSFILSDNDKNNLQSKFSTANISTMSRTNPRVFTEQAVYMLATILKTSIATSVSVKRIKHIRRFYLLFFLNTSKLYFYLI